MRMSLEVFGEPVFHRTLLRFEARAMDMSPAFEQIVPRFFAEETKQFDSEGAYASGGWQPLAASTIAEKEAHDWDPRILHRTLRLRRALTGRTEDTVIRISRSELFIGANVPYGVYHQSRRPRTRLPRRPPVAFTDPEKREWVKVLQRFLIEGR